MNIVKHNPNRAGRAVSPFFTSFFDDFFTRDFAAAPFSPSVDIAEADDKYEIHVALPGFKKEDVSIEVKEGRLTVSGERKYVENKEEKKYHRVETSYGKFTRSFKVPELVNAENISASFTDGILEVVLPKDEKKLASNTVTIK